MVTARNRIQRHVRLPVLWFLIILLVTLLSQYHLYLPSYRKASTEDTLALLSLHQETLEDERISSTSVSSIKKTPKNEDQKRLSDSLLPDSLKKDASFTHSGKNEKKRNQSIDHLLSNPRFSKVIEENRRREIEVHVKPTPAPTPMPYTPKEGVVPIGVLSEKPKSFFKDIRFRIDNVHPYDRCRPYKFLQKGTNDVEIRPANRKIFFGCLIADEPEETLEIIAAETYGLFEAMVFVESNRTQHFVKRPLQRQGQEEKLKKLFGVDKVQIRTFFNENPMVLDLQREHEQRDEILKGWKELGMTKEDVGYLADLDETFTRDFLLAIQQCPDVEFLDYKTHLCHPNKARIIGAARVFEALPDCIAGKRTWHHPDMIIGACIELIGDSTIHPVVPRTIPYIRDEGYGLTCGKDGFEKITDGHYPLFSAADFRRMCGGEMIRNKARDHTEYTAYHFHNFFHDFGQTRFKYKTYGHPHYTAYTSKLEDLNEDLELVYRCLYNMSNADNTTTKAKIIERRHTREEGGLESTLPNWPVYFHDKDYRRRKYKSLLEGYEADEKARQAYVKGREEAELARRAILLKDSKILSF
ncbi:expressed unknown protein [Seminavis robusta]|uniref:Uncharacterized protein n=1 Tax=Seminavis robusta TaxID=568900 RepID=A0A9N8DPL9_9STRA|nr:expressed unknown protein [Seminavis robusta]|eukprot:Sro256_g100730.1 n/a (584) ;mRNA; r:65101-66852